jgi:hypothetical protein
MEPVKRTRREETATSAAPARIARRVEEEEEEVVAMVWMCGKGVLPDPTITPFWPSLYCCCCFSSPPETPSKLRKS